MKLIDWAKQAEQEFRSNPNTYEDDDFDLPGSRIFYIDNDDQIVTHSINLDLYQALSDLIQNPVKNVQIIGIETCGWACQLEDNEDPGVAPSEHPNRVRMRMVTVADLNFNTASVLILKDRPDDVLLDGDGEESGPLADALRRTVVAHAISQLLRNPSRP